MAFNLTTCKGRKVVQERSSLKIWAYFLLMYVTFWTKYSRMDQVTSVEDSLKKKLKRYGLLKLKVRCFCPGRYGGKH